MGRWVAAALVLALAVASLGGVAPAGGDAGEPVRTATAQDSPAADFTATEVQVAANGSAHWTVRIRTRLASSEEEVEFEAFQDRFRENTSAYLGPFSEGINATVEQADDALGRDMQARDFAASTHIQTVPREWGVVTYEFTWTNFAQTNTGRLVVGDVFQGGFFVAENDTLAISPPPEYELVDATPEPTAVENETARWVGQRTFGDGTPRVVFESAAADGGGTSDGTSPGGSDAIPSTAVRIIGVLLALALVIVASFVAYRRRVRASEQQADRGGAEATGSEATSDASAGDGANEADRAVGAGGGVATTAPPMTDEERVLDLLADHGGQIKQKAVVDHLGWSKSKTSRVLSSMAEEGDIEKFRIGRENVIRVAQDEESE